MSAASPHGTARGVTKQAAHRPRRRLNHQRGLRVASSACGAVCAPGPLPNTPPLALHVAGRKLLTLPVCMARTLCPLRTAQPTPAIPYLPSFNEHVSACRSQPAACRELGKHLHRHSMILLTLFHPAMGKQSDL